MKSAPETPAKNKSVIDENDFEVEASVRDNLNTEYFSIGIFRLIILSSITLGFYIPYWFYRNWTEVKNSEQSKIYPLLRAAFTIFFCYPLFKKVLISAQNRGYEGSYSPSLMAILYLAMIAIVSIINRNDNLSIIYEIVAISLSLLSFLPFIAVQKAINFNNSQINPNQNTLRAPVISEIIWVITGIIICALIIYMKFFTISDSKKEEIAEPSIVSSPSIPNESVALAENIPPIENTASETIANPALQASSTINNFSSAAQPLNPNIWKVMNITGKFKVTLPGTPAHDSGELETAKKSDVIKFDSYSVTMEDATNYNVFFTNVLNFPASFAGSDDELIRQTLDNTLSAVESAKIISSKPTSFNSYKAMEFLLQADDVWLKGRIVVNGKTSYVLSEGYFEKNYNESDFNKFINSLVIY